VADRSRALLLWMVTPLQTQLAQLRDLSQEISDLGFQNCRPVARPAFESARDDSRAGTGFWLARDSPQN